MSIEVFIPTLLRPYTGEREVVRLEGTTVGEVLEGLIEAYPGVQRHLFDEHRQVRDFVNIFRNEQEIRYLKGIQTRLHPGDTLSIIPSVAGGRSGGSSLDPEEVLRYSRHLIMPEVGMGGQIKLKEAAVLCVGAGGLGSPLALYLAAAGVGRLGLVDFDVVDFSNLQRQILHHTSDVGRPKLDSAVEKLRAINPAVGLEAHELRLSSENALELIGKYDVVADGSDNFPTRYLVNDACVLKGKPNVHASVFRFEGQASVFGVPGGPCYRCLYPAPPPPGLVPSCAEGGVLGILPGLLGVIQATETIKLILGKGESLVGRLLLIDALAMRFREMRIRANPDCALCGNKPTISELVDYEDFCGVVSPPGNTGIEEVTATELKRELEQGRDIFILDVRNPPEVEICRLKEAHLIPLDHLMERIHELDSAREIVVHCKSGARSARAIEQLKEMGFRKLRNLKGGILAWAEEVQPEMIRY